MIFTRDSFQLQRDSSLRSTFGREDDAQSAGLLIWFSGVELKGTK